jgi:predicted transcriptional regulator
MKTISVSVDDETWQWVEHMAQDNRRSRSEIVRGCIRDARAIDRGEFVRVDPERPIPERAP